MQGWMDWGNGGKHFFFSFFLTVSYNWPRKATCVFYTQHLKKMFKRNERKKMFFFFFFFFYRLMEKLVGCVNNS